jgi:hypothetical protein
LRAVDDPQQIDPDRRVDVDESLPAVSFGLGDQLVGAVELLAVLRGNSAVVRKLGQVRPASGVGTPAAAVARSI